MGLEGMVSKHRCHLRGADFATLIDKPSHQRDSKSSNQTGDSSSC